MPPRNPLGSHPTVVRRFATTVEAPSEGPLVDALIADPQAVLDGHLPRTISAVSLPASVAAEADRARTAIVEGVRHVYRGEAPARLSVDLPPAIHKALKLRCIAEEISIREFILRAIARDGIVEPVKQ